MGRHLLAERIEQKNRIIPVAQKQRWIVLIFLVCNLRRLMKLHLHSLLPGTLGNAEPGVGHVQRCLAQRVRS